MSLGPNARTVGAVIAGFVLVGALSSATDAVLQAAHVYPPESQGLWDPGLNALALAYRCAFNVLGGWVTGRLAPAPRARTAIWALAILGQIAGIVGLVVTWNMNLGPHWYPIALAAATIPTVWLGGWLALNNRRPSHA